MCHHQCQQRSLHVSAKLNFKIKMEPAYNRLIWQYDKANFDKFRTALSNANFDECFNEEDVYLAAKTGLRCSLMLQELTYPIKW